MKYDSFRYGFTDKSFQTVRQYYGFDITECADKSFRATRCRDGVSITGKTLLQLTLKLDRFLKSELDDTISDWHSDRIIPDFKEF